jgi:hypothetical protein
MRIIFLFNLPGDELITPSYMNVRFIYRIYSGVHRQQKEWDR